MISSALPDCCRFEYSWIHLIHLLVHFLSHQYWWSCFEQMRLVLLYESNIILLLDSTKMNSWICWFSIVKSISLITLSLIHILIKLISWWLSQWILIVMELCLRISLFNERIVDWRLIRVLMIEVNMITYEWNRDDLKENENMKDELDMNWLFVWRRVFEIVNWYWLNR